MKMFVALVFRLSSIIGLASMALPVTAYSESSPVHQHYLSAVTPDAQAFRQEVLDYVKAISNLIVAHEALNLPNSLDTQWNTSIQQTNWQVRLDFYSQGQLIATGNGRNAGLAKALADACRSALESPLFPITNLNNTRIKVTFDYYPNGNFSFIDFEGKALEMVGNRVAVRSVTTSDIEQQLTNSTDYLLKVMHPKFHGFYKFYDAKTDVAEPRLRTIYSASSLLTLIKLQRSYPSLQLEQYFRPIADFLLSMQVKEGDNLGGFYYSFSLDTEKPSQTVVVGTTSKTIFTLLELYRTYHDESYLDAAKRAGDWLLTRIDAGGQVSTKSMYIDNQWINSSRQSHLYSGQVLSALSRLYLITGDKQYLQGANKIADAFLAEVKAGGLPVSDDYRKNTIIGTSWVLMSLIDYAAVADNKSLNPAIASIADYLLSTQINNASNVYNTGRYSEATTPSGNGWINEVLGEYYPYCVKNALPKCDRSLLSMSEVSRWLLQNSYNSTNVYDIKNPARATGGFILTFASQRVRTDSVCHGVNSFLSLLGHSGQQHKILLTLPEPAFKEILPSLRAGGLAH